MRLRGRPTPTGRRAIVIAVVLSLLLPGLGHAFLGHLTRALVWFAGTVVIAIVVGQGGDNTTIALSMGVALALLSAADVLLLHRMEARSRTRL